MKMIKDLAALTSLSVRESNEILQVPVNKIESKRQVRTRFEKIEELANSFKTEGQQTPITIVGPNSVGMYTILRGERRWRAAQLAEFKTIDAIICNKEQTQSDIVAGQLIENIQREDLTALEIASSLQELFAAEWANKKIAERIGKSESYVSTYLSLNKLPDEIKDLNYEGYVTDATSLVTLRKMYDLNMEQTLSIVQEIHENQGVTRNQIRKLFSAMQASEKGAAAPSLSSVLSDSKEKEKTEIGSLQPAQSNTPTGGDAAEESEANENSPVTTTSDNVYLEQSEYGVESEPNQELSPQSTTPLNHEAVTPKEEVQSDPIASLGARRINPSKLVIEVLVIGDQEEHLGQLLVDYVSENKDKAWVNIDDVPMEVDVGSISILEIRDKNNEN